MRLDSFIQDILNHPRANQLEGQQESEEILKKDSKIAKFIEWYDKLGDIKLKKIYGIWILIILSSWILFVIVYSFFQIFANNHISDAVFITLLTTATANILGLPIIILNYLFPKRKELNKLLKQNG